MIPDCFDPGVPLLGHLAAVAPPPNVKQEPSASVGGLQQQQVNMEEPSVNLMTFDEPVAPPTQPVCPFEGNSQPHPQEKTTDKQTNKCSSQRPALPTPFQILSNPRTHILGRNPWQVGAALIDSTMHQLDNRIGRPSGMYSGKPSPPQKSEIVYEKVEPSKNDSALVTGNDTDDDEFQVNSFKCLNTIELFSLFL